MAASIPPAHDFQSILSRPADQRRREFQYRFAQSVVFGLPVVALQAFGRSLGGPEADRWVAILQALLAGWVMYVGSAGMLFEGVLWLARRRLLPDLGPAALAAALYLWSAGQLVARALRGSAGPFPQHLLFHWAVVVLVAWTGVRLWQYRGTEHLLVDKDARPMKPGASQVSPRSRA